MHYLYQPINKYISVQTVNVLKSKVFLIIHNNQVTHITHEPN